MLTPSSRCSRRIRSNSSTLDISFSLAPTAWQPRSVGTGLGGGATSGHHSGPTGARSGCHSHSAITRAFATLLPDVIAHRATGRGMWLSAAYQPQGEVLEALIH